MSAISLNEFADRLNQLMPVVMKEFGRRMVKGFHCDEVTFSQFFILELLFREGESKMSALAQCAGVSTPAMTGIADRLVKSGYIARKFDPDDRRLINVELTAKGAASVKRINQERREAVIKIFGKVSQEDREDYLRVLTRIHQAFTGSKKNNQ